MTLIFMLMLLANPQDLIDVSKARKISVHEVLDQAMKGNRTLREVGYSIVQARLSRTAALGIFKPTITSKVTAVSSKSDPVPGSFFSVTDVKQYQFEAGINKLLSTGGVVSLSYSGARNEQTMIIQSMGNIDTKSYSSSLTLAISHPLLAGFGVAVTRVEIDKAKLTLDAERINLKAKAEGVVRDIVTAYWDLVMTWNNYHMLLTGLKVSESQLKLTEALIEGDRATQSDLLAVKTAVAQRQGDILQAKSAILAATSKLKILMGMDLAKAPWLFLPTTPMEQFAKVAVPSDLFAVVVKRSKDLAVIDKKMDIIDADLAAAENKTKPKLDLTLSAGPTSATQSFSESFTRLVKFNSFSISAGLNFTYSMGAIHIQETTKAILRNSLNMMRLAKGNLKAALRQGALLALNSWQVAKKRVSIATLTIQNAELH
ncbi:TolC family protein, partial [Myxococcota bacterium]|nr:TolC family protein [Myxococcota bacterium]